MVKPFGGEMECAADELQVVFTDSGRSSLRLILNSELQTKKFLLPDFLCRTIVELFEASGVSFSYYHINPDLSPAAETIQSAEYDVLYGINYFGNKYDWPKLAGEGKVLIEDNVFLPYFEKPATHNDWIGFNSFRKIAPCADASLLLSSIELPTAMINPDSARFAGLKAQAKAQKHQYLNSGHGQERDYLQLFQQGEQCLDDQQQMFRPTDSSVWQLMNRFRNDTQELNSRTANFHALAERLETIAIHITPHYPSFFPIKVARRDQLRQQLFSQQIYLPIHWPAAANTNNELYDSILSIPLDSRYTLADMQRVAAAIMQFERN